MKYHILTYHEVATVAIGENGEPLVNACLYDASIVCLYEKDDMHPYLGDEIVVRDTVARKLAKVQVSLQPSYRLKIVYGYRHPEIQERYFNARRSALKETYQTLTDEKLDELTHNFIAVPSIAGHPTGAAIDLTLLDVDGRALTMGTGIADYTDTEAIKTFCKNVAPEIITNRMILHNAMLTEGFAPFYGEWWHFSYGDREWAVFYKKEKSLYAPLSYQK